MDRIFFTIRKRPAGIVSVMGLVAMMITIATGSVVRVANGQENQLFTLPEAVRLALANSDEIRAARFDLKASELAVDQGYTSYLPVVRGIGSASTKSSTNPYDRSGSTTRFGLEVSQLIFDFGKAEKQVSIAREQLKERELILRKVVQNTIRETVDFYVDAWHAARRFEHYLEHESNATRIRDATKARTNAGLSPARELSQVELRLRRANTSRLQAEFEAISQRERISIYTGREFGENVSFELDTDANWFSDLPQSLSEALKLTVNHNLDLHIARSRARQASLEASSAFREFFPSIRAIGRYEAGNEANQSFTSTTGLLDVDVSFYEGGRVNASYQRARSRALAVSANLSGSERRSESSIRVQWSRLGGLEASRSRWAESLQEQKILLSQIEAETNEGLLPITVLLDARTEIIDLIVGFERFAADLTLAKINLMELVSRLSPEIFGVPSPEFMKELDDTILQPQPSTTTDRHLKVAAPQSKKPTVGSTDDEEYVSAIISAPDASADTGSTIEYSKSTLDIELDIEPVTIHTSE